MPPPAPSSDPRSPPIGTPRWLADLKRRKVPRVVAAYGAVSLLVIEVADLIFPRLLLPDWSVTLVIWLAILGFPVVVALTWALEWTPEGVRRTAPASDAEIAAICRGRAPRGSRASFRRRERGQRPALLQ